MEINSLCDHLKMVNKSVYILSDSKINQLTVNTVSIECTKDAARVKYTLYSNASGLSYTCEPEDCFASIKDLFNNLEADFALRSANKN